MCCHKVSCHARSSCHVKSDQHIISLMDSEDAIELGIAFLRLESMFVIAVSLVLLMKCYSLPPAPNGLLKTWKRPALSQNMFSTLTLGVRSGFYESCTGYLSNCHHVWCLVSSDVVHVLCRTSKCSDVVYVVRTAVAMHVRMGSLMSSYGQSAN